MRRLSVATRIALIVLAALVAVQLLMLGAYVAERQREGGAVRLAPLLERMASVVRLMDMTAPAGRPAVLAATRSVGFEPRWPAVAPADVATPRYLGPAANRMRRLIGGSSGRTVVLGLTGPPRAGGAPVARLADLAGAQLRAVVALDDGTFVEMSAGGGIAVRLLGLPLGLLAGILGAVIAFLAVIAVRREMRPLSALAQEVERFGTRLDPRPVEPRGAPDVQVLIAAFNAMQARIAELVRTRSLVLGAMSHDLKTYITRLRLRLELMPPGPQVEKAQADVEHMQALLDDALSFARSAFSDAPAERTDLSALVRAECEAALAQGQRVTLEGAVEPHEVEGSPQALRRVIANLISNAVAYGQCADVVLLRVAESMELAVCDRGPGIPEAVRQQVFEPFHRLEPSRSRAHGGAGLGLTIVRQIVEALGGRITITDRPGGGACFRVVLPAAPAAASAPR